MIKGSNFTNIAVKLLAICLLSSCASGVKLSELDGNKTKFQTGKSQIIIYRKVLLGAAWQPTIHVNGLPTGTCAPNGVFIVDVVPGEHNISAQTEVEETISVQTRENGRVYVECYIGFGLFAGRPKFKIVNEIIGEHESNDLSFTGRF